MVREAADALHRAQFQLSIATVPNTGTRGRGRVFERICSNWRAAYGLKAIGASVDLLCPMTYFDGVHCKQGETGNVNPASANPGSEPSRAGSL